MRSERTRTAPASLLVILLLVLGCGPNVTLSLPNGYQLLVLNARDRVIVSPSELNNQAVRPSVGKVEVSGGWVYGTRVDPDRQSLREFFVLDTRTGEVEYFFGENGWRNALLAKGITDHSLRHPSAFFNVPVLVMRSACAAIVAIPLICLIGGVAYFRRQHARRCAAGES